MFFCFPVVTVETGFRMSALTVNESINSVDMCLATLGTPVMDTIINVTVMYGSAGEDGEMYNGSSLTRISLRAFCGTYSH